MLTYFFCKTCLKASTSVTKPLRGSPTSFARAKSVVRAVIYYRQSYVCHLDGGLRFTFIGRCVRKADRRRYMPADKAFCSLLHPRQLFWSCSLAGNATDAARYTKDNTLLTRVPGKLLSVSRLCRLESVFCQAAMAWSQCLATRRVCRGPPSPLPTRPPRPPTVWIIQLCDAATDWINNLDYPSVQPADYSRGVFMQTV